MTTDVQLTTPRLLLRPPRMEDFEAYAAFMADEETARHIGGVQPRHTAWRSFMTMAGAWSLQGFAMFCVLERDTGRWVGRVGPWQPDGWPGTEVGWGIVRAAWKRGYATEAAAAAIDWAFDRLGWTEVVHVIDRANVASQRVAAKLGSTRRAPCRLPPPHDAYDVELWAQTRAQWRARGAASGDRAGAQP